MHTSIVLTVDDTIRISTIVCSLLICGRGYYSTSVRVPLVRIVYLSPTRIHTWYVLEVYYSGVFNT